GVRLAVINAAHHKLVQMAVQPAHRGLDDTVQPVELHICPHDDPSPDGRLAVTERDFQSIERRPAARVGESDLIGSLCPLPYQRSCADYNNMLTGEQFANRPAWSSNWLAPCESGRLLVLGPALL